MGLEGDSQIMGLLCWSPNKGCSNFRYNPDLFLRLPLPGWGSNSGVWGLPRHCQ